MFVNAGFGYGRVESETVLKSKAVINISHSVHARVTGHLTIAETQNKGQDASPWYDLESRISATHRGEQTKFFGNRSPRTV
jgi:hypothetical protein